MTSSFLAWSVVAILVFWAVGAYNRLVRLRSEVNASFSEVQGQLEQQAKLVDSVLPPDPRGAEDEDLAFLAQIRDASAQLAACLEANRPRPLDHERLASIVAASRVLTRAWERAEREDLHDLAGPQLPTTVTEDRARLVRQAAAAVTQFDDAVDRYNRAIAQFPALFLAWVFSFKPGRRF
jgi:LemA protein